MQGPVCAILNLYFGSITVLRSPIKQSVWLKASSVMVKLYFGWNTEYLLLFHQQSRPGNQATGPVCVQHVHAARMATARGYLHQDIQPTRFTNHSDSAIRSSFRTVGVEKSQPGANIETYNWCFQLKTPRGREKAHIVNVCRASDYSDLWQVAQQHFQSCFSQLAVSCNMRLQVTEEASLQSVILASIPCQGPCGRGRDIKQMQACKKTTKKSETIFIGLTLF